MTWETTSFPSLSAFNHCVGIYHFTYQRTVQLPLDTDVNGDNNNSNSNNNLYRLWHAFLLSQDLCPFRFLENNVMKWSKSERDKQILKHIRGSYKKGFLKKLAFNHNFEAVVHVPLRHQRRYKGDTKEIQKDHSGEWYWEGGCLACYFTKP